MIADSTEIKFACSRCGQRLSVDSSGAGMTTACPTCEQPLVVPQLAGLHDRGYGATAKSDSSRSGASAGEETIPASKAQELRDELLEARRRSEKWEGALATARQENARLQQQLEKVAAECGRQTASATAVLAKAQSLQADRQQLQSELAESRQRAAAAETQLEEARARIAQLVAALEAAEKNRAQWDEVLAQTTAHAREAGTRLSARETELREALAQLAASAHSSATAREASEVLEDQRAKLSRQLENAHGQLLEAAATRAALSTAEENLAAAQLALTTTEAERNALSSQCQTLRREVETLRHDLEGSHAGHELLVLRERFQTLETGHQKATATLARVEAEAQSLTASGEKLRADLTAARESAADAERRAEAASESALQRDNGVLRGIISRQNTVLEECFTELRRLKRARFVLRIIYALFALGLLGLLALAFDSRPDTVKHFLHDWFGL